MPGPGRPRRLERRVLIAAAGLAAALLVFLPRLTNLGGYLIIDEADRWRWAGDFFHALLTGDLHATLIGDGYPGIVPVWVETLWLLGEAVRRSIVEGQWFRDESIYMLFHVWSRTEHLALQRLPIALFNGLLTLLVALYAGRLYGRRVGLLTLILVALDPFYLADSRVNRAEAVISGLLTLSVLALVDYGRAHRLRPLIASGILGGLAFLTKIQGLVVLPVVGVTLSLMHLTLWPPLHKMERGSPSFSALWRRGVTLVVAVALWLLAAAVTWVILWPAMWVQPHDVLSLVYDYATRKAGAEGVNVFFAGQHFFQTDPGWLFYPVVAVLRVAPLTMVGLLLAIIGAVRRLRSASDHTTRFWRGRAVPLVIYVVLYALAMSIGNHKQDRYLMPIFLVLDIVAALGWVAAWDWIAGSWLSRCRVHTRTAIGWIGMAGFLVIQAATVLPYHPYYFPYFNPLAGGGAMGARMLRVGWGEGMDGVAAYLNGKPEAANLTVAARWFGYMLGFVGRTLPFDQQGRWTQADYMVLYIQQTQRMIDPSPGVIRYFQRQEPEHVIALNGIEYAQIYRSPFTRAAQPSVSRSPGQAALFGYRWDSAAPDEVRVVWENQRADNTPVTLVAALTRSGKVDAWEPCRVAPGFEGVATTPGEVVESVCPLNIANDHPKEAEGTYDLRIAVAEIAGQVTQLAFPEAWQSLAYRTSDGWHPVGWNESLDSVARRDISPAAVPADRYFEGRIRLAAYTLSSTSLHAGQPLTVTLFWQVLQSVETDYVVFNHLYGLDGTVVGVADGAPSVATSQWLPGQVVSTSRVIESNPALSVPAAATLQVGLYDKNDRALPITDRQAQPLPSDLVRVKYVPAHWSDESPPVSDGVRFGDRVRLTGHSVTPLTGRAGSMHEVHVTLWWQSTAPIQTEYAVFVHLLDEADTIVAQADGVPVAGRYPTSSWSPGERIVDARVLALPANPATGGYRILVGLYSPANGERLPIAGSGADSYQIARLRIDAEGIGH